jgi:hypothetical protein
MDQVSGGTTRITGMNLMCGGTTQVTEKAWRTGTPACVSNLGKRGTPEQTPEKISGDLIRAVRIDRESRWIIRVVLTNWEGRGVILAAQTK